MNKSTNIYRKCAFCPHHNGQTKCCCKMQKTNVAGTAKRAKSIKPSQNCTGKNRMDGEIQNMSSIDYFNPRHLNNNHFMGNEQNQNFNKISDYLNYTQINIPTLIAQNSILKTQNGNLKKQLMNVSSFHLNPHEKEQQHNSYHKQYNNSTINSYNKNATQQQGLMDKLYISNRNLQEAILKIQALSKANHQVNQQNIGLNKRIQKIEMELHQYEQEISRLSRCQKKSSSQIQAKCKYLLECNLQLNRQLQVERQKTHKISEYQQMTLSPQWIAETSNKVKMIQKGLNKLQHSQNINTNADEDEANNPSQTNRIKEELFISISNAQSQVKKFHSSLLVEISSKADIMTLVKILIQNILQSVVNSQMSMQNELIRKISSFEKKVDYLMAKLQNLVLSVRNKELRKRSTSRSRISAKRNILSKQENTFSRNSVASKQNFNTSNSVNLLANRPKSQFNY